MFSIYLPLFVTFALVAIICAVMFLGGQLVGTKNPTPGKLVPFECGTDTPGAGDSRVCGGFYLTAVLFVVFGVGVVFMCPWGAQVRGLGWNGFFTMFSFIAALIVALAYCWKKGALEWES
jgi:NADH-quinone oxidoreductase subunit A